MDLWFWLACGNTLLLYLAPLIGFIHTRSVLRFSPYAYLFTFVSCSLWIRYAVDWGLEVLSMLSQFGALTAAAYTLTFVCLSERDDHRLTYLLQYFGAGGVALLVGAVGLDVLVGRTTFLYSLVCCASSCFASVAPAYNLPRALQERSMSMMPHFSVPLLACPNAIQWIWRNIHGVPFSEIDGIPRGTYMHALNFSAGVAGLCAMGQLFLHLLFRLQPPPAAPQGLEQHLINHGHAGEVADPAAHQNGGLLDDHSDDGSTDSDEDGNSSEHADDWSTDGEDGNLSEDANNETTDSSLSEDGKDNVQQDASNLQAELGNVEGEHADYWSTDGKDGDHHHSEHADKTTTEGEYVVHVVAASSDEQVTAQPPTVQQQQQQQQEIVIDVGNDDPAAAV